MPGWAQVARARSAVRVNLGVEFIRETFERYTERVVWLDFAPGLSGSGAGSHPQARAPPSIS